MLPVFCYLVASGGDSADPGQGGTLVLGVVEGRGEALDVDDLTEEVRVGRAEVVPRGTDLAEAGGRGLVGRGGTVGPRGQDDERGHCFLLQVELFSL